MLSQHVIGDELDMLGLYLVTSLNFVGLPPGYSARLDPHYTVRDEGENVCKSRQATIAKFYRLCKQITHLPLSGWNELTAWTLA